MLSALRAYRTRLLTWSSVEEWLEVCAIAAGGILVYSVPMILVRGISTLLCKSDPHGQTCLDLMPRAWGGAASPTGANATRDSDAGGVAVLGEDRAATLLLAPVAAFIWYALLHGRFLGQSIAESRVSPREQRSRRSRGTNLGCVLMLVLHAMYAPLAIFSAFLSSAVLSTELDFTAVYSARTAFPFIVAATIVMIYVPESMHFARPLRTLSAAVPKWAYVVGIRVTRCVTAWIDTGDPLFYDKRVACHTRARFISMFMFGFIGMCAYIRMPTRTVLFTTAVCTSGVILGSCRNDGVMVVALLLYSAVLCALQRWSRTRARAGMGVVVREERECRFEAEEISNWAGEDGTGEDVEQHLVVGAAAGGDELGAPESLMGEQRERDPHN